MKDVHDKARLIRVFIGLGMIVSLLVVLTGCWPFNTPPEAYFTASPLSGPAPLSVTFNAMLSEDPDGFILKWEWDFGDGESGVGESVPHTYDTPDTYEVTLRVTDDDGATATMQRTITVIPGEGEEPGGPGPTASFTVTPLTGNAPLTVYFNASASSYLGHAITAYFWDFGDGVTKSGSTYETHIYSPTTTTTYTVSLRVIASDKTEDTTTRNVTVVAGPSGGPSGAPDARFTMEPNRVLAPLRVYFDPSDSSAAGDREIVNYIWTFGDGTVPEPYATPDEVVHRYVTDKSSETFSPTLVVIDDEGGTDSYSRNVIVENEQPVAGFEIYNVADPTTPPDPQTAGWKTEDVTFIVSQTGTYTIWFQSKVPENWQNTAVDPDEPDPRTDEPGNYADHNLCYDPEGQGWTADAPDGFPNDAWGIRWLVWDYGDTDVDIQTLGMVSHQYTFDAGFDRYTVEVTARDWLGAETSFSREIIFNKQ